MNKIVLFFALAGYCLAMPQRQSGQPKDNTFVKILELESYQNGADYGHALQQEDGTATGQKVYYRAGQGVGYEVLKVEGLDIKGLGNLKPTISKTPQQDLAPQPRAESRQPTQVVRQPVVQQQHQPQPRIEQLVQRPVVQHQQPQPIVRQPQPIFRQPQPVQPIVRQPQPIQPIVRQPQPVQPIQPIIPQINPLVPEEPTPAPHRFDYPANLNLQRTGTGFRSSFKAL
ncbi:hypothetical protein Anas_09412 [Armadillidium nasatum]|uniref:Uncharacterized protein n=1 Tax=Armadillidium nasatum TaxID=96803 RepID=A0A5N5T6I1_9CRUS|nr:hypothetical protein Anas_09412 [Armadillidium nasatum]